MAIRQYIGARYMPKFMGTYDATTAYEALSVVDNGMGTSYVANKPVPVGTPLTNTDYWAVYGASSGAIIHLQDQIDTINNTTIPGITNDIENVEEASQPKRYKNVVCIADSWGGTDGWCDKLNDMEFSEGTFQKEAHGGIGFQTGSPNFGEVITNMTPLVDADKVDCVIIIGGTNDQINLSTLPAAIGNTVDAAKAKFPNAKVYVGFNLHLIVGFGQIDATEGDGSAEVLKRGGYPLTGLSFNQRYCKSDWESDNWHLSNYNFFARMIYSGIYNGTIDVPRILSDADMGISSTVIRSVKTKYVNGYCYASISLNPSQTFAVLARIIDYNDIPIINLHGRAAKVIKSSTSGDTIDLSIEDGCVDTSLGGQIGTYPIMFTVVSHHGCIIS